MGGGVRRSSADLIVTPDGTSLGDSFGSSKPEARFRPRRTRKQLADAAPHSIVWDGSDYLVEY